MSRDEKASPASRPSTRFDDAGNDDSPGVSTTEIDELISQVRALRTARLRRLGAARRHRHGS
ncbi:hypothetical protein FHR84_002362 [Actinopolyspora biskrensis]|uniref:Uncharacterized protein n=2 Tax=Actinopolyspora TaxID=1849 RepID=A0A1H1DMF3_9ACTN|nr:hypothetical protein [Actinopolyspora biskrensis]SDQ77721.1 hypothetical protein SAMN04489718_2150 [Actinopolyspora saharensis]